jgi:hypothetical protein
LCFDRRRTAHLDEETDIQRPPDSRMNRLSEHSHRLSLGRPLSSPFLVTRAAKSLPHDLLVSLSARACCKECMPQDPFAPTSVETAHSALAGSLHVVTGPSDLTRHRNSSSAASVLELSNLETPSSWPASSIRAAIRCVYPRTLECFFSKMVFAGATAPNPTLLLPAIHTTRRPPLPYHSPVLWSLPANTLLQ